MLSVELSPETCRVKPLRRINAIVHLVGIISLLSMMHGTTNIKFIVLQLPGSIQYSNMLYRFVAREQ